MRGHTTLCMTAMIDVVIVWCSIFRLTARSR